MMIKIIITKYEGSIDNININGHAGYDHPGKDLVCASISAITTGIFNALSIKVPHVVELRIECGSAEVSIKRNHPNFLLLNQEVLQTMIAVFIIQLETIQKEYPQYISIKEIDK